MALLKLAKYGKDKVRLLRVKRNPDGTHDVREWIVCALVEGEIAEAWTESDNRRIVATDSIKNMAYIWSKTSPHCLSPEKYALDLALHLVGHYAHLHKSHVEVIQLKWSRIPVAGKPHKHSFVRNGDEKRICSVEVDGTAGKDKMKATVSAGIKDLLVLKSTESSFENFVRDEFRTLPDVDDRIFSTAVDCSYTIPISSTALTRKSIVNLGIDFDAIYNSVEKTTLEIFATHNSASVQATLYQMCEKILEDNKQVGEVTYKLPNKHYFAVDQAAFGLKNTAPKDAEVFMPVDAPSGLIIATVGRDLAKL